MGVVKHASAATLTRIDALLALIRREQRLVERRAGIFYVKGKAFLHFHEDPSGIFADLKRDADWVRFAVNTDAEQARLLQSLGELLAQTR
jgi:hypothetical protein